jgi:hypothetical protein
MGAGFVDEASRIVLEVKGDVTARNGPREEWRPLAAYDPVVEGMEIRTGADGEASVAFLHGCSQKIAPGSKITVRKLRGSGGPDAIEVSVEIDSGTTFTIVPALPDGSKFSVADACGVIEVDPAEGCELRSIVENSEVLELSRAEQGHALGFETIAPIRQGRSQHSNFRGRAIGHHFKGKIQVVRCGESLYFHVAGFRIGPVDDCNFAELKRAVVQLKKLARDHLLTESEIRAFLANLGSGGLCDIHVTPIGR